MPPPSAANLSEGSESVYRARRIQAEYSRYTTTAIDNLVQAYFEGRQWYWYDRQWGVVYDDAEIRLGVITNLTRFCVETMAAQMTAPKLLPCVASTPYTADLVSLGRITEAVARKVYNDNGGNAFKDQLGLSLCIHGLMLARPYFDDMMEDTILLSRGELETVERMRSEEFRGRAPMEVVPYGQDRFIATMRMGGIRWEVIPPTRVFVPDGATALEDCNWLLISHFMPVEVARQKMLKMDPNARVDLIQPVYVLNRGFGSVTISNGPMPVSIGMSVDQTYNQQQSFSQIPIQANVAFLQEYWYWEDGAWNCDYYTGAGQGELVASVKGMTDHGLVDFRLQRRDQIFWPVPPIMDLWQLQNSINKMQTQRIFIYQSTPGDMVLLPAGATISPLSTQKGMYQATYSGNQKPELLQFQNAGIRYLAEEEAHLFSRMMLISRISQAQMGSLPDRLSANALAEANEMNQTTLRMPFENIKNGLSKLIGNSIRVLKSAGELTTYPRLVSGGDPGNMAQIQEWSQDNLVGLNRIVMDQRVELPNTYEERFNAGLKVMDMFAPGNEAMLRNFDAFVRGDMSITFQDRAVQLAAYTAEEENKAMLGGVVQLVNIQTINAGDPVSMTFAAENKPRCVNTMTGEYLFQSGQLNDIHLEHHARLMQDPTVPEPIKAIVRYHMDNEHRWEVAQQQQAAFAQQVEQASRISAAQATGPMLTTAVADEGKAAAKGSPNSQGSQGSKGGRPSSK